MPDLTDKSILITGGTGSFGKKFVDLIYQRHPAIKRLVIYSRDELKQFEMAQQYPRATHPSIQFMIGDVRDGERLKRACEGIDIIIHTAALKQVSTAEYNPMECIKTNVLGSENVINAALDTGVQQVVALSTDKAAAPISLYGATKLCSDKLFIAANHLRGHRDLRFSVVRHGNFIGSRGSVVPLFLDKRKTGTLPITHPAMTRFTMSLEEGVDLVLYALEHAWGGEIFVPKIPSYRLTDLATAIAPGCEQQFMGIRPGEKLHEEMITETDSLNTLETDAYYIITPPAPGWCVDAYKQAIGGRQVKPGFHYNSEANTNWLTVSQLRKQIRDHVDANFTVDEIIDVRPNPLRLINS